MSDIALQSGAASNLTTALQSHSNKENFVPKLGKCLATHYREVVRTGSMTGGFNHVKFITGENPS